jgi:hypothetical protein
MSLGLLLMFAIQVAGAPGVDAGNPRVGSETGREYETAAAQRVAPVVTREFGPSLRTGAVGKPDGDSRGSDAVRPMGAVLADALKAGHRRSNTFNRLLDRLEHSDLIVYLQIGSCPDAQSIACLSMLGASGSNRFVRVTFVMRIRGGDSILAVFTDHLIAQIGHELQHAVEIADDPGVVDGATLDAAYARWGFRPDPRSSTHESVRAIQAGRSVLDELRRSK